MAKLSRLTLVDEDGLKTTVKIDDLDVAWVDGIVAAFFRLYEARGFVNPLTIVSYGGSDDPTAYHCEPNVIEED